MIFERTHLNDISDTMVALKSMRIFSLFEFHRSRLRPQAIHISAFWQIATTLLLQSPLNLTPFFFVSAKSVLSMPSQTGSPSLNLDSSNQGFTNLYIFLREAFQSRGLVRFLKTTLQLRFVADRSRLAYLLKSFSASGDALCRILNALILQGLHDYSKAHSPTIGTVSKPIPSSTRCKFSFICDQILFRRGYYTCLW